MTQKVEKFNKKDAHGYVYAILNESDWSFVDKILKNGAEIALEMVKNQEHSHEHDNGGAA